MRPKLIPGRVYWIIASLTVTVSPLLATDRAEALGPCAPALAQGAVCEAANQRGLDIMRAGNLEAITVMQDVQTGSLVAFAASDPAKLDVATPLLPLSTVKLLVAASWWDHEPARKTELVNASQLLTDMMISGNDDAGRQIALALRKSIGTEAVLKDLESYGFLSFAKGGSGKADTKFWSELTGPWQARLIPAMAYHSLDSETIAKDWADTLSIGEGKFVVTALHLSRFLQAVGNGGVMLPALARAEETPILTPPGSAGKAVRIMEQSTALKLQAIMRGAVERGTAKSVARVLAETGWQIGGKTGTGPGPEPTGPNSDGWFAGLIFDPQGKARFTVATFVKHGGLGGVNAARVSAELALFLSGG